MSTWTPEKTFSYVQTKKSINLPLKWSFYMSRWKGLEFSFRFFTCKFSFPIWECIFMNCTYCNESPQQIPFQFANGQLPHFCCRAFWPKPTRLLLDFYNSFRTRGIKNKYCFRTKMMTYISILIQDRKSKDDLDCYILEKLE